MKISRGLAALILTLLFQITLSAEYLYKDNVINNPKFNTEVEKLGSELYKKTGISLRLVMIRELPHNMSIVEYEKELIKDFTEPTILLTFAELDSKVSILANDTSLYKYFNREQVLSPVASPVQAFLMAVVYARSFDEFMQMSGESGGTILPLLAGKAKKGEQLGKYSGSMFNGYLDIAVQIAQSKGVTLEGDTGNTNKDIILIIKIFFYGTILYGIFMYIRIKIKHRREKLEHK